MHRIALKNGDKLSLRSTENGEQIKLEILGAPLGRGSSCIVYEAISRGKKLNCKYRLKELYPRNISGIYRNADNDLIISEEALNKYNEARVKFDRSAELLWKFAYSDTTGCYTVCPLEKFEGVHNGAAPAAYLITQWMPSDNIDTVDLCGSCDLELAVKICLKTAYAAMEFHKMGYINLDIKPENILYSPKTESISFFDTDTIFRVGEELPNAVAFSQGAAPEIVNGYKELYSEKADVYSIGSMLHRFITGQNYYPGQYARDIGQQQDVLAKNKSFKHLSPDIIAQAERIFCCCDQANPTKRITTAELAALLEELLSALSPEDCGEAIINKDVNTFSDEMEKMKKANIVLRRLYSALFCIFMFVLCVLSFAPLVLPMWNCVICIIIIPTVTMIKAMIFKRAEQTAIADIKEKNCRKHYKAAFEFGNSLNNHQLFEISAPEFIPPTENSRHRFRIIIGSAAIISGVVTAFVSFLLNSFPILIAAWAVILLTIFMADYGYSLRQINIMYNERFGTGDSKAKKNISEIYNITNDDGNAAPKELSPICIKMIMYNEYKSRCNRWGTADVVSKMLAGVIILLLLRQAFSLDISSYFRIPDFLGVDALYKFFIIIFSAVSVITVCISGRFYKRIKDILFTVNCDNDRYLQEKFDEYTLRSILSKPSFARGIYNSALLQFENGIDIRHIRRQERPTLSQYCISQNARTIIYCLLITIDVVCITVWHFRIYGALIPIILTSLILQFIWYKYGVYKFYRIIFGIKQNETAEEKYTVEHNR